MTDKIWTYDIVMPPSFQMATMSFSINPARCVEYRRKKSIESIFPSLL